MKALIQRVARAWVEIDNKEISRIGHGFLALLGIGKSDTRETADALINKIINLRIFSDTAGKMNHSLQETGGEILLVSQFTLYTDCSEGRRPSFIHAADAGLGKELYEYVISQLRSAGINVQTGEFGATMQVGLVNDGPVTIMLDTDEL